MNHVTILPDLWVNCFRLTFVGDRRIRMPQFPGSAWRGAFGHALRKNGCVTSASDCNNCHARNGCPYAYIFETPPSPLGSAKGITTQAPRPYVLEVNTASSHDDGRFTLQLTLIGKAIDHLGIILYALQQAGTQGVAGNHNLQLEKVEIYDGANWSPLQQSATAPAPSLMTNTPEFDPIHRNIVLYSPLRIKFGHDYISPDQLNPVQLIRALFNRIWDLARHHGSDEPPPYPGALHDKLRDTEFTFRKLYWQDLQRHSSRQERKHPTGGIMGTLGMDTEHMMEIWPALWIGQFLHLGKLTTMGHGGYYLSSQACEQSSDHP